MKILSSGRVISSLPFNGDEFYSKPLLLPNTNVKGGAFVSVTGIRLHNELAYSTDYDTHMFRVPRFGIACQCVWDKYHGSLVNHEFHERCMIVGRVPIIRSIKVEGETEVGIVESVDEAVIESILPNPVVVDTAAVLWSYGGSISTVVDGGNLEQGASYVVVDYNLVSLSAEEQLALLRPVSGC